MGGPCLAGACEVCPSTQWDKTSVHLPRSIDVTCILIQGCVDGQPAFPFACPTGVASPRLAIEPTSGFGRQQTSVGRIANSVGRIANPSAFETRAAKPSCRQTGPIPLEAAKNSRQVAVSAAMSIRAMDISMRVKPRGGAAARGLRPSHGYARGGRAMTWDEPTPQNAARFQLSAQARRVLPEGAAANRCQFLFLRRLMHVGRPTAPPAPCAPCRWSGRLATTAARAYAPSPPALCALCRGDAKSAAVAGGERRVGTIYLPCRLCEAGRAAEWSGGFTGSWPAIPCLACERFTRRADA